MCLFYPNPNYVDVQTTKFNRREESRTRNEGSSCQATVNSLGAASLLRPWDAARADMWAAAMYDTGSFHGDSVEKDYKKDVHGIQTDDV